MKVEIYVHNEDVLVSWGQGDEIWWLSKGGAVAEAPRIQGDLVWADGEPGFNLGHAVGHDEGYEQGVRDADRLAS